MKHVVNRIILAVFGLVLLLIVRTDIANATQKEAIEVKVGYYEDGVFEQGALEGAVKSGYAYDYYQKLSEYTGWKYTYVYGEFDELYQLLAAGDIDLLAGLPYEEDKLDKIYYPKEPMGENELYIGVNKDRLDLVKQLDYAQKEIFVDDPFYYKSLISTYYPKDVSNISLSEIELEWINTHDVLVIGFLEDYMPYSDTDGNGEATGLIKDLVPEMLERLNLDTKIKVEYKGFKNFDEMVSELNAGRLDAIFPAGGGLYYMEQDGIYKANPIISMTVNIVYEDEYPSGDNVKVAVNINNSMQKYYVLNYFPDCEIVFYDSIYECLTAVKKGKADCTIVNGLRVVPILKSHKFHNLETGILSWPDERGFSVKIGNDSLLRLLNHGTELVGEHQAIQMCYQYLNELYIYTVQDFIRDNFTLIMIINLIVVGLIIYFIIRAVKKKNNYLAELQKQMEIIGGLSKAFFSCYGGDLKSNQVIAIKETEFSKGIVNTKLGIEESLNIYLAAGVHEDDMEKMKVFADCNTLKERLADKDSISIEFHATQKVFEWCRATWVVATRDADGNVEKVLYAVEDITREIKERKRNEKMLQEALLEAEAASKAKSRFLFNMSHDIRTPMNAIIGFADLLEKHSDEPEKCKDYLYKIKCSSQFLLSLINNVLEMARIESGKTVISETPCSVYDFNDSLFLVFDEQMKKKNITFIRSLDVKNKYVSCDIVKLREVFLNVLSNAFKYTNEGGTVKMILEEIESDKDGYALFKTTISDNGIGMSKDYLPYLFDDFSREHTTTESKVEGTGLGMSIVKRFLGLMDGTIEVDSEQGKGTTFTIKIYHRIVDESEVVHDKASEYEISDFKGKRILLAEDNDLNAEIAMEILKEVGFEVDRAEDGVVCIDLLQKAQSGYYNLILMDVQMPNMDGYKATKIIREMDDESRKHIPIIAMTANAFEEDKQDAYKAGMNAHLSKPIKIDEFMSTLSNIILTDKQS